jgi:two-component system, chemotaxis family, chemotaxis protein CheY
MTENQDKTSDAKLRGTRVLLADDEAHVRVYLKFLLTRMRLDVVGEAANGDEAVRLYRELRPDIALLDLNMPVKTGEEALKEIMTEFPGARVIMLSSLADRETVETCASLGAINYIRKDCKPDEMREIIEESLA